VECCVRDRDFSQKKVYHCELCDRWFCEKHIEPRLAFIRDYDAITRYPELRVMLDNDWKREDGHPDFAYTRIKFLELDIEEKNRNKLIKQALDTMNHYYAEVEIHEKSVDVEADRKKRVEMLLKEEEEIDKGQEQKKQVKTTEKKPKKGMVSEGSLHFIRGETEEKRKRHLHINVKGLAVSTLVFLVGLGWFLFFFSKGVYLIFIIPFIPFPIPFWVFGIGAMIFGALGFIASIVG
jgi:hypothetical protein